MVAANRLPVKKVESSSGDVQWKTSPGGLVSALTAAIEDKSKLRWVGWNGSAGEGPDTTPAVVDGIELYPISLTQEEKEFHYDGMSNGTLWPLYHDKVAPVDFHRHWYLGYRKVNQRFADQIVAASPENATVWIHDYQLQLVPEMVRSVRPDLRIGFFLHIPFPPEELFMQLPWRRSLTHGILGSDLVGFQTPDGAENFRRLAQGLGLAKVHNDGSLSVDGRKVVADTFPIGISWERYAEVAEKPETVLKAQDLRAHLGQPHVVLLGVDRLDYTKGIDVRLRAFKELLAEERIHPGRVSLIQLAEPSRDNVQQYVELRARVEQLVSETNGDYGRVGFPVVHYIHQTHGLEELITLYRTADVMLVTPLRDGMNLVAKEYVACRYDKTGVLLLSEFAGAAHDLEDGAILVNPHDIDGLKDAILRAITMSQAEATERMELMRETVKRTDAANWAMEFLSSIPRNV